MDEAQKIIDNGTKYYIEVANMPTTNEALAYIQSKGLVVGPLTLNAGGQQQFLHWKWLRTP